MLVTLKDQHSHIGRQQKILHGEVFSANNKYILK